MKGRARRQADPPRHCLPLYRDFDGWSGPAGGEGDGPIPVREGHPGLLYDKFVDRWKEENEHWSAGGREKQLFFKEICRAYQNARACIQALLRAYHQRRDNLVKALGGCILEATTEARLVAGLGNGHPFETGLIWHPTLGVPYLPGSSIKGLMRAWASPAEGKGWGAAQEDEVRRLFGDLEQTGAGSLIVFDALPVSPPRLELDIINPHFGEYYRDRNVPPADYLEPTPVYFLAVAKGQRFRLALAPRPGAALESGSNDVKLGAKFLKEALATLGAGGKTAVGYGLFKVT